MKKIIDFLKKNIKYVVIILCAIAIIIYIVSRERFIAHQSAKITELRVVAEEIRKDRDAIQAENKILLKEKEKIQKEKDSIKLAQAKQKAYYEYVIKKHQKEIDSLLNVPDDSVYVRLQPFYPNLDQDPLEYRFSGPQIRQIYTTTIFNVRLKDEFGLQGKLLNTCNDLNKKYEDSEKNFRAQIDNLNRNIALCDKQVGIKEEQLKLTQRQLNRKTFWGWTQKGAILILGTLVILK